jgi:hypothetical protein
MMILGIINKDDQAETAESAKRFFPRFTVFPRQLTFSLEKFYHNFLHNETAFAIQRHLHWSGITNVILPIRIGI